MDEENERPGDPDLEDAEIEIDNIKDQTIKIYKKLDVKDLIIILMALLLLFMYMYHTRRIDDCVIYFNDMMRNESLFTWNLTP